MTTQQRFIVALVLALATAAVMAGIARAEHPSDRAGMLGIGGIAAESVADTAVIPNDRGGMLGVGRIEPQTLQSASVRPDDRGGLHGPGVAALASSPANAPVVAAGDPGFQWRDAVLGAAAALAIVFFGLVGAIALRQRRVLVR